MLSNALTVVSTFSVAAAAASGFAWRVSCVVKAETIEAARICYRANSAKRTILDIDIRCRSSRHTERSQQAKQ